LTKWTINVMTTEDAAQKQEAESSDLVKSLIDALEVDEMIQPLASAQHPLSS
jgi:hypothetical protein